ncbi:MAG: ATP/GTP-binding protein, partial [Candidatus Scatosoma sp.]
MLIDFRFKNFMSFGDECCFDMIANSDKQHVDSLIDNKYSRVRLIYGANASGKTSFIRAIAFVRWFILHSNQLLENMPIPVVPFKFRQDSKNLPSEFALTFIMQGKKYYYEFSCTQEKVLYEKLDVYNTAKPTNIFERTDAESYEFKRDVKALRDIASKTTRNKLFLATSANWNFPMTKPVVEFLLNTLLPYSLNEPWETHIAKIKADGQFEDYKKFCLQFFNNADLSIDDFAIEEKKLKEMPQDPMFSSLVSLIAQGKA